jgi:hypothetical protein
MNRIVIGLAIASSVFAASAARAQTPATSPSTESAPAALAAPVSAAPAAAPAPARSEAPRTYTESASLVVSGKAELNGTIQIEFTPLGAPGKLLQVNVLAKTGRKDIAKDLHKELVIAAGSLYKVKLSGDTITITKAKGAQNFSVLLEKLDLSGVSVLVKKG